MTPTDPIRAALDALAAEPEAPPPSLADLVNAVTAAVTPEGGYELGQCERDGSQLTWDGKWWEPVFGCDSLENTLDAICTRLIAAVTSWHEAAIPSSDRPAPVTERDVREWINSQPLWHGATRDELISIVMQALARWGRPAPGLPDGYIDPEHQAADRDMLETFYTACLAEGGTADEITLRGLNAVLTRALLDFTND